MDLVLLQLLTFFLKLCCSLASLYISPLENMYACIHNVDKLPLEPLYFLCVCMHVQCFWRYAHMLKTQPLFKKNSYGFGENQKNMFLKFSHEVK